MANSKIIYFGETLIDLTADTVQPDKLLLGYTAHDKAGEVVTGSCNFDANTSDATAGRDDILLDETAYVNGVKLVGSMPNNGAVAGVIAAAAEEYTVPLGYHDGGGKIKIKPEEQAKLVPANIKSGVEILGVTGSYGGETVSAQKKTVTPAKTQQSVVPDAGYDYLSEVVVAAVPYTTAANSAGGMTVTIGA